MVLVGRWGRRLRLDQGVGRHVVEQPLAVEVEVSHVAVERGRFLAARRRLAEDDGVNVQREVFARQHSYSNNTTHTIKVLTTQQPSYLANIIRFRAASRQLRSCGRNLLHDDRTNLAFADCDFSHAAPAVWNSLPLDILSNLSCLATFKRLVKTELYNRAYLR